MVLNVSKEEIEGAEYNKRTIQEAASYILHKWRDKQNNHHEAFDKLYNKLWDSDDFRNLAVELQEWADEEKKNEQEEGSIPIHSKTPSLGM